MSLIRGGGNKDTELKLIKLFRSRGISGWRRNSKLFGKPDFIFPRYNLAVFADGCFWHGCPKHSRPPLSNAQFWLRKLTANKTRDRLVNRTLKAKGWRILRIWEHELTRKNQPRLLKRIERVLTTNDA